jgi:hypothetical protein
VFWLCNYLAYLMVLPALLIKDFLVMLSLLFLDSITRIFLDASIKSKRPAAVAAGLSLFAVQNAS